jgi:hypothetical protein
MIVKLVISKLVKKSLAILIAMGKIVRGTLSFVKMLISKLAIGQLIMEKLAMGKQT